MTTHESNNTDNKNKIKSKQAKCNRYIKSKIILFLNKTKQTERQINVQKDTNIDSIPFQLENNSNNNAAE